MFRRKWIFGFVLLFLLQGAHAGTGKFFNVVSGGDPANLSINLCLNGKGPLTCQKYSVTGTVFSVSTRLPNRTYPYAGIKINTAGYSVSGCTPLANGYCIVSIGSKSPKIFAISRKNPTTPGKVGNIKVYVGNQEAYVSWSAPSTGSPATYYIVTAIPQISILPLRYAANLTCVAGSGNTACTVTGLTNDMPYKFDVQAFNEAGGSTTVTNLTPVSPTDVIPQTPRNVVGITPHMADSGTYVPSTITWDAVTGTNISYLVSGVSKGYSVVTTTNSYSSFNLITDSYTVRTIENSVLSTPSNPTEELPGANAAPFATAGDGRATVTLGFLRYYTCDWETVYSDPGNATCDLFSNDSCVVQGLKNNTTYIFYVTGTCTRSFFTPEGPVKTIASLPVTPTGPYILPGQPTNVSAAASSKQATVYWSQPLDGGSGITGYNVVSNPDSQSCSTNGTTFNCTVLGLTAGTEYTFNVSAINSSGAGPVSTSNVVIPIGDLPTPPMNLTAVAGNTQATVSWTAPSSSGDSPLHLYTVISSPLGGFCTANPPTTTCVVTGLTNGQSYTFTATATNQNGGVSPASAPSNAVTPVGAVTVPSAPTGVTATAGANPGQIIVSWTASSSDGGSPITTYQALSDPDSEVCMANPPDTTCTVNSLISGNSYTFTVKALNSVGYSSPSTPSNAETAP